MSDQSIVFELSPEAFQSDVVERSRHVPVVLLFWAAQVPEAAQIRQSMETLANQYQGKFALGLIDVSQDQTLAQHMRVQGLPSMRVVSQEKIIDQLDGPQSEQAIREFLDRLTMSSGELLQGQLSELLEAGNYAAAEQIVRQFLSEEPANEIVKVQLADVLALQNKLDEAERLLTEVKSDAVGREKPERRIEFAREAAGLPTLGAIEQSEQAKPEDLDLKYQLAVVAAANGDYELALEKALQILKSDRKFKEDLGRTTMLRIFDLLEKGSPLAAGFRRRMFAFMH